MDSQISMIRYEQRFQFWAEAQGWHSTKAGWPDFFVPEIDGGACVEVKQPGQRLTTEQRARMDFFKAHGILCYRWDAMQGLQPYDAPTNTPRLSEESQCASCGREFRFERGAKPVFCSVACRKAAQRRRGYLIDGLAR